MAQTVDLPPVERTSDKSSDSGGLLLDLSSQGVSGNEDTWLFDMEAKMKGTVGAYMTLYAYWSRHTNLTTLTNLQAWCLLKMKNFQRIFLTPGDLGIFICICALYLYMFSVHTCSGAEDSLDEVCSDDCLSESLSKAKSVDQWTLLPDNTNEQGEPHVASSSVEATSGPPKSLLDDLVLDIEVSAADGDKGLPSEMAIESENSHQPTLVSDQGTKATPLLDDFGFNIRLSAPLDKEGLPAAHREGDNVTDGLSSSERSGGLRDELDDFGFDISIPVKLTGRDLSSTQDVDRLMTFASPVVVKKESETKKLLEELGIDENLSKKTPVPPVCERTPLDDFESHLYSSASCTEVDIPPKSDVHVVPPTLEDGNNTQTLLCDFAFNANTSTSCTKIVSPPMQDLSPPISEETSKAQSLLNDFGFDVRPTVSCSGSDLSDTQKSSPPSLEEVDCCAQNLLGDFGFEAKPSVCLEGKESATASSMSPPISEDSTNAPNLLDGFGFEVSPTSGEPLPEQNSTVEVLNTGTDNLLNDFGFDVNPTRSTEKGLLLEQNSSIPTSEQGDGAQNLLEDFGFEVDRIPSAEKAPLHPEQNSFVLIPTSLATSDSAPNLLDDFGFDIIPSAGKEASSAEKSSPHIPEQNGDAQNLMDDFGFDVSPLATCTEQEMQVENTSSSTSGNLLEDFGFCSNTPVPCLSDNLPHSQTVENLLTPPSSSSERSNNIAATSLLEDFGFETSSSNSCSDKARPTTDDVTDKKLPVSTSGGSKPVERDLPLIAFSDDVVLMWKKDEGSHTASPTDKDADLMPSPRGGEEYSPAAAKLDGTVIISESGMHTASPTDKDTDLMPSPCGGEEHSPTAAKLDGTVIIGESGVTSTAASIDGEVVQSHVEEREEEEEEKVERKKKSRLPAPSHQLTKCSSFLRSVSMCTCTVQDSQLQYNLPPGPSSQG